MITEEQWLEDRRYVSMFRYGIDKYNACYSEHYSKIKIRYGKKWREIPYSFTVNQVNDFLKKNESI